MGHELSASRRGDRGGIATDTLRALQDFGFTEYEAKAFCALVAHPGASGYEVAKHSSVPRARVYEALDGLVRKGAAVVQSDDGRRLYYPQDHKAVIGGRRERLAKTADALEAALDLIAGDSPIPEVLVFRGREQVMSQCRQLIDSSRAKLLLSGWPEDLTALGPDLQAAHERGVDVYVLSFGQVDLPVRKVFHHNVSPLQYLQVAVYGRWLEAASDLECCLAAQIAGGDRTVGFFTRAKALVFSIMQGIYHNTVLEALAAGFRSAELPASIEQSKRAVDEMLVWRAAEIEVEVPAGVPGVSEIMDNIRKRLEASPDVARDARGSYEFRLSDDGAGVYHVDLRKGLVDVGPGPIPDPGLVVTMRSDDFRAMAASLMPLAALHSPGRIRVSGDHFLAGKLQVLLGG